MYSIIILLPDCPMPKRPISALQVGVVDIITPNYIGQHEWCSIASTLMLPTIPLYNPGKLSYESWFASLNNDLFKCIGHNYNSTCYWSICADGRQRSGPFNSLATATELSFSPHSNTPTQLPSVATHIFKLDLSFSSWQAWCLASQTIHGTMQAVSF